MREFQRQYYESSIVPSDGRRSPVTQLPAFMVGTIKGSVYGLEQLVVDLNGATFGWSTDIDIHPHWDFILVRNINQSDPTVDIYAVPKTNERRQHGSPYGFYFITDDELKRTIARWEKTQGVIATFIEGWLKGRDKKYP